jgi:RNA polymerase sigma-70 factor (ECF subfamily)
MAEGNHYAFTQIFHQYSGRIYGVSYKILKSHLMAQEIVQDVFMKIWLKRAELVDIENFAGFLLVTARNLTFDRIKHIAYETAYIKQLSGNDLINNTLDHGAQFRQYLRILQDAINHLPDRQKQVYLLAKESGWSHEQIAAYLKISKLTAKKHLVIAVKSIRKYFAGYLDPDHP